MSKITLIAEIGWNHLGNMDLAKQMIDAAANSGADYAKFQTWSVKGLKPGPWDTDGRKELYEKAELTEEMHEELYKHCEKAGIKFLTSCFSENSIPMIRKFCNKVKLPSCECRNEKLVLACIRAFDEVYVSTGSSTFKEATEFMNYDNVTLLHCVSSYPCPAEIVNLPRLLALIEYRHQYGTESNIGYSGHYHGIEDAISAICMGATVIEKHFTLNNDLPGKDNKFALTPDQFAEIAEFAKTFEQMSINRGEDFQESEKHERDVHSGRWDNYE